MKLIKLSAMLALALAMTFAATGCKKKPVNTTLLPGYPAGRTPNDQPPVFDPNAGRLNNGDGGIRSTTGGGEQTGAFTEADVNQDPTLFASQTVHFALDSHLVQSSERVKVEYVAATMNNQPTLLLIIEGHCDERGTEEYNRALGSQRALALREALVSAGISGERILTKTFGEDRPAVQGHNEAAWKQNRRGVFIACTRK